MNDLGKKQEECEEVEKRIVKDILFLFQVSHPASQEDLYLARDLQDTLLANRDTCVGLAANMIGVQKRVIIFNLGLVPVVMFNPVLLSFEGSYEAEEGCLSLVGVRSTKRYETIRVAYRDSKWQEQTITLTGFPAQICQHELDHLEGRII
ncbi:polypeptide deformylase [Streptococcus pneumoniae]|nr:polypeptide deformylase [Streptococcus pneumoniae]VNC51588.1 polypeptide deformylase [Streptococcus pneumoniae]